VGDYQRIPAAVCFFFFFFLAAPEGFRKERIFTGSRCGYHQDLRFVCESSVRKPPHPEISGSCCRNESEIGSSGDNEGLGTVSWNILAKALRWTSPQASYLKPSPEAEELGTTVEPNQEIHLIVSLSTENVPIPPSRTLALRPLLKISPYPPPPLPHKLSFPLSLSTTIHLPLSLLTRPSPFNFPNTCNTPRSAASCKLTGTSL